MRRRTATRGRTLAVGIALMALVIGRSAHAQEASVVEAQRLFEEAMQSARAGHFEEARAGLTRSLALAPRVPTAFNLVAAIADMGDFAAAARMLERLQSGEFGEVPAALEERMLSVEAEIRSHLGVLRVRATGAPEPARVVIDGASPRALDGESLDVYVLPGEHSVVGLAGDQRLTQTVTVELLGVREVVLPFTPQTAPEELSLDVTELPPDQGGDDTALHWGIGVGAVVLVLGAVGLVLGLTLTGDDCDPVWGCARLGDMP